MGQNNKTLEEMLDIATLIITKLDEAVHPSNTFDESQALYKMKSQVEIVVTDLCYMYAQDEQDLEGIADLQQVLFSMYNATAGIGESA